jgi:20S proteasome alpha/beta subunit
MTLVIAAQGEDFVVVAADSRGTIQEIGGTRVEINLMVKLVPITKLAVVLMYGEAESANYLVESFRDSLEGTEADVREVATKLAKLCREDAKETKGVPAYPDYFPNLGFIIAGLVRKPDGSFVPRCYSLKSIKGFKLGIYGQQFAIEGKPIIALYKFARDFKPNMTQNDLSLLVAQCVYDTEQVDGDVGGRIRMGIIDETEWRSFTPSQIRELITEWPQESEAETAELGHAVSPAGSIEGGLPVNREVAQDQSP